MITVATAAELLSALSAAAPGDVIALAPGAWGNVTIDGYSFLSPVTIRSLDPSAPATFDTLSIKNSGNLVFDGIAVTHTLAPGEPDWVPAMRIDKSDDIVVRNATISGSADGNHTNDGQGLLVLDSTGIEIEGSTFHDLKTGLSIGRSANVLVHANAFSDIRSDGIDLANVRDVTVDANTFTDFHPALALGDHPDMIQVWNDGAFGDMSNIAITGNTLSRGSGGDVQAIFVQGALAGAGGVIPAPAHDILVSGNDIDGGAAQGIWLSGVADAQILDNTLTLAEGGGTAPTIRTDHTIATTVAHNTAPQIDDIASTGLVYIDNTITAALPGGSTIDGTVGADTLLGTCGNDVIHAGADADIAWGSDGNDLITGDDGNDILHGEAGNDTLNGGAGNDELHGGDGNDGLFGGGGKDRLFGENGDDTLFGDGGDDMLNGGAGNDTIFAGTGNDGIYGGGGNDCIRGEAGNDTIYADGGNDIVDGGSGDDILRGGSGYDVFVFATGAGNDRVLDFQNNVDKLDFTGVASVCSMADLDIMASGPTGFVIHYFDGIGAVTLEVSGVAPFVLDATDFLF